MPSPRIAFDHLVVAAKTLEIGENWVREQLGVTVPRGGAHGLMATQNCVGKFTDSTYFEIIAVNPDDTPERVRWFAMDEPSVMERLERDGAYLHHWVVNTSDIAATLNAAQHDPGPAIAMQRGDLKWKIAVRNDGKLAYDGLVPSTIEWPDIPHPAGRMTELPIVYEGLTLRTPDVSGLHSALQAIGVDQFCSIAEGPENRMTAQLRVNGDARQLG